MKYLSHSEATTEYFAASLARDLHGGEVLALSGNLGAGKTAFVRGLAAGLGLKKGVASPTFVLMKVYKIPGHPRIKKLVHIDAYRLESEADLEAIGVKDFWLRPDTVTVIEWPERVKKLLPPTTKKIKFKHKGLSGRVVEIL